MNGALLAAGEWLGGFVTGPLATGLAILAVLAVGYSTITGALPKGRALRVLLGTGLLFAAPQIAQQIASIAGGRPAMPGLNTASFDQGTAENPPRSICWTCR